MHTDSNILSHLQIAKLGANEQRWASQLANFDIDIRYKPVPANGNADTMSRQNRTTEKVLALAPPAILPYNLKFALQKEHAPLTSQICTSQMVMVSLSRQVSETMGKNSAERRHSVSTSEFTFKNIQWSI